MKFRWKIIVISESGSCFRHKILYQTKLSDKLNLLALLSAINRISYESLGLENTKCSRVEEGDQQNEQVKDGY